MEIFNNFTSINSSQLNSYNLKKSLKIKYADYYFTFLLNFNRNVNIKNKFLNDNYIVYFFKSLKSSFFFSLFLYSNLKKNLLIFSSLLRCNLYFFAITSNIFLFKSFFIFLKKLSYMFAIDNLFVFNESTFKKSMWLSIFYRFVYLNNIKLLFLFDYPLLFHVVPILSKMSIYMFASVPYSMNFKWVDFPFLTPNHKYTFVLASAAFKIAATIKL